MRPLKKSTDRDTIKKPSAEKAAKQLFQHSKKGRRRMAASGGRENEEAAMNVTEQMILTQAPNSAAAENGRKLSQKGSFTHLCRTADGALYWAECKGSGKNPYRTSIDFSASDSAPVCRCSCPSRQFPCKHALGLMFELLAGKEFETAEIPEEIAAKRAKQAARAAKKDTGEAQPPKPKKTNTAAQKKKLRQQLEGLDQAERMVNDLLSAGISTLSGSSAQTFEKLAKDLGNFYLTGPQAAFSRIALTVRQIQTCPEQAPGLYAEALRVLIALHAAIKKSREFLNSKLEAGNYSAEDSILYEALGGIWRLEDLKALGSCRENARLVQLSFDVFYDEAKREYVERGFWLDLERGDLVRTLNYRPVKALKHVKAEDSCFELLEVPTLYEYPGKVSPRVRWEGCTTRPLSDSERRAVPAFAREDIPAVVKLAKNQMKNTLLPKYIPALLPVGQIGTVEDNFVLEDPAGNRILLRDRREDGAGHASAGRLASVSLPEGSAVFGLVFYDGADRRICLHPYSAATPEQIIRLQY